MPSLTDLNQAHLGMVINHAYGTSWPSQLVIAGVMSLKLDISHFFNHIQHFWIESGTQFAPMMHAISS